WAGVNLTTPPGNSVLKVELHIEGALNGNYDSQLAAPLPIQPPAIAAVSPAAGRPGVSVAISGSNFGTVQGSSTVAVNGAVAAVTAWSATIINALVPAGATTGPLVVTVRGRASNGVAF